MHASVAQYQREKNNFIVLLLSKSDCSARLTRLYP